MKRISAVFVNLNLAGPLVIAKCNWRIAALLITFVIGVTNPANATPTTFNIEGYVSQFSIEGLPDYELSVGDRFSGTLAYELKPTVPRNGGYTMTGGMSPFFDGSLTLEIEVEGKTFGSGVVNSVSMVDDPSGDSFGTSTAAGDEAWSPWYVADTWLRFFLADNSGTAISSLSLPNQLEIAAWPDAHYLEFSGETLYPTHPEQFMLRGQLTSIAPVPEFGSTGTLLALVLVPLLAFGSHSRRRRHGASLLG
jgi:hypothetical protein